MSDEEVQYSIDETVLIARTIIIIYILIAYNEMILNVLRLMLCQGIALCCIAALNLRYKRPLVILLETAVYLLIIYLGDIYGLTVLFIECLSVIFKL